MDDCDASKAEQSDFLRMVCYPQLIINKKGGAGSIRESSLQIVSVKSGGDPRAEEKVPVVHRPRVELDDLSKGSKSTISPNVLLKISGEKRASRSLIITLPITRNACFCYFAP